jgi:hypothetical protein
MKIPLSLCGLARHRPFKTPSKGRCDYLVQAAVVTNQALMGVAYTVSFSAAVMGTVSWDGVRRR